MGRLLALIGALLVGAALAWATQQPPKPVSDWPADRFSAGAALQDVQRIARAPHPVGSAENAEARRYLLTRMTALDLAPQVRAGIGLNVATSPEALQVAAAPVQNLLGVIPGRDRTAPAVLLMAHYDSVPNSPGAADDAAGVAAALEIARILRAQGPPARDVMILLTDGEEAGLLGADAFFRRDPLARRVGFVINMEARGSAGRVHMFQTGPRNAGAVALLQKTAERPSANSLSGVIYRRMPNDTDFTRAMEAGLPGLNFAFIGRQFDYHSPTATPQNLDLGTLQDLGDQVLAAAREAAFAPALPAAGPDRVYGHLFGDLLVSYPPAAGWLVLLAAAGLIGFGFLRARRAKALAWREAAQGVGGVLYMLAAAVAVLHLARAATGAGMGWLEQRPLLAQAARWEAAVLLLALGVLLFSAAELARGRRIRAALLGAGAGLGAALLSGGLDPVALGAGAAAAALAAVSFGRPAARSGGWAGVLIVGLALAVGAQFVVPEAAHVFAWPLLAAGLACAATSTGARRDHAALAVLALVAAVSIGWIGGLAHLLHQGLDAPELLALPLLLAAFSLWPLAQPAEGAPGWRGLGPALMVVGAAIVLVLRYQPAWDGRTPQVASVVYHLDQDTDRAFRVRTADQPSAWTDAVLKAGGGAPGPHDSWAFYGRPQAAPAPAISLPAPQIRLEAIGDGRVRLVANPPAGARVLTLRLRPDAPTALNEVGGAHVGQQLRPGRWNPVRWEGGDAPLQAVLRPAGPGVLEVRYSAVGEAWPEAAGPLPRRPAELMPFGTSDAAIVTGTRRLAW